MGREGKSHNRMCVCACEGEGLEFTQLMYSFLLLFFFLGGFSWLEMEEKGESGLNPLYGSMRAVQAQSVLSKHAL